MFFYKPILEAASLIVTYKRGELLCRCLFVSLLFGLCALSTNAQDYCPDGTLKPPGTKCPPARGGAGGKQIVQPTYCSIKVKIDGVATETLSDTDISLENYPICVTGKQRNKKSKPYSYNKSQKPSDGKNEVVFTGFLCGCSHSLMAKHSQYTFKDNPKTIIRPKPSEIITFEAIPREQPKPAQPPCNSTVHTIPISFDEKPIAYEIKQQSNCRNEQNYFNEHKFEPKEMGYIVSVNLVSDNLGSIDFQVLQDGGALDGVDAGSTPQALLRQYEFHANKEYILRVKRNSAETTIPLKYELGIRAHKLMVESYKAQMDKAESLLGAVKTPSSTHPIFNSLNRQIEALNGEDTNADGNIINSKVDSSNLGTIRRAAEILQSLTEIPCDAPNSDQAVVHSALGIIYRYCLPDASLAQKHDLLAIQLGGAARFRVRFSENKEANSRYRHWFLVRSGEIALERLVDNPDIGKFMSLTIKDLNKPKELKTEPEKKSGVWILGFRSPKKTYYLAPMSKNNQETSLIKKFIERSIE